MVGFAAMQAGEAGLRETLDLVKEGRELIEYCATELEAVSQGLEELRARAEQEGLEPTHCTVAHLGADPFSVTDPNGNVVIFGLAGAHREGVIRSGMKGPLQHLTLATRNVDAIEGFYAGKLGFAVSDFSQMKRVLP